MSINKLISLFYFLSLFSLISLITLCLLWELTLVAKYSYYFITLKILPLLFPIYGIIKKKLNTFKWSPMLILLYFIEGIVLSTSENNLLRNLAFIEVFLSMTFFFSTVYYVKLRRAIYDL